MALLGDLTFLHDLTGLVIGPHEPRPDLTIVVSNNDGGAIFSTLEPGEPALRAARSSGSSARRTACRCRGAEACGHEHVLVSHRATSWTTRSHDPRGIRVVEVPTSRTELAQTLSRIDAAVRAVVQRPAQPATAGTIQVDTRPAMDDGSNSAGSLMLETATTRSRSGITSTS